MPILSDAITNILRLVESSASRPDLVAAISTAHDAAEAVESDERLAKLESENAILKEQLHEANLTIDSLRKDAEKQSGTNRPDPKHDILLLLMTQGKLSEEQIVKHLGLGQQPVKLALAKLREDNLISFPPPPWGSRVPVVYSLTTDGRSNLDKTGELR